MRHNVYGKKLGRNKNERTALFKSLVLNLFSYGTIETSESKAKAVKGLVDKIINLAKNNSTQHLLQSYLVNKDLQQRLIEEIAPKLSDRVSGYTTMLRIGTRAGDRSTMVRVSLIHNEQLKPIEKKALRIKNRESSEKIVKTEVKKTVSEKKGRTGQSIRKTHVTKKRTSRLSKTK